MRSLFPFLAALLILLLCDNTNAQDWQLVDKLVSEKNVAGDNIGISVAVSGNFALAGAWWEDNDDLGADFTNSAGAAYFFKRNPMGEWEDHQVLNSPEAEVLGYFGFAVAMDGDWAFVGAYNEDISDTDAINAGRVYCYNFDESNDEWNLHQEVLAPDPLGADYFGYTLEVSGNYLIVGAYNDDEDPDGENPLDAAGSVYFFEFNGTTWDFVQKSVASDRDAGYEFGRFVDISGDRAIVGSHNADDPDRNRVESGAAYIFERNSVTGKWIEAQVFRADDGDSFDQLGWDVVIEGDEAVVGARSEAEQPGGGIEGNTGAIYFLERQSNAIWQLKQKLYASDFSGGDFFGGALALDNGYLVVGAEGCEKGIDEQEDVFQAGSAYLFQLMGEPWRELQKFAGTDRMPNDLFGASVAIDSGTIVVGAWLADRGDDNDIGAIYIYEGDVSSASDRVAPIHDLRIYPNPSADELFIDYSRPDGAPVRIDIMDFQGRIMSSFTHASHGLIQPDVDRLAPGAYVVRLTDGRSVHTAKWIKL